MNDDEIMRAMDEMLVIIFVQLIIILLLIILANFSDFSQK